MISIKRPVRTGRFIFLNGTLDWDFHLNFSESLSRMTDSYQLFPAPGSDQEEIKILSLTAEPYPDGRRVKVQFTLSSFTASPNASLFLTSQGKQLVSVNIVNIFLPENEITLHIPEKGPKSSDYQVALELFFLGEEEIEGEGHPQIKLTQSPLDSASISFTLQ